VSDGLEQSVSHFDPTILIFVVGVAVFALWLIRTSLGRTALLDSPPRRNRMAPYLPFVPFAIWLVGVAVLQDVVQRRTMPPWLSLVPFVWRVGIAILQDVVQRLTGTIAGWRGLFLDNLVFSVAEITAAGAAILIARTTFARGLRGFGLRVRTIPRDLKLAALYLLAVWPVVFAMIVVTTEVGKLLFGKQFAIPPHPGLDIIMESGALPLRVLIVILAVVVAPLVEEMLFRGLVQTTFRSYTNRPWLAIIFTSLLFATFHTNGTHWPALFVLGMGLGYAYEKSGSLFRPIFMHALFNGITIAAALAESAPA
jgi:membrane protease YdiL (CAAX protease family)